MSLSELLSNILQPFFDLLPRIEQRPSMTEWLVTDRWFGGHAIASGPVLFVPSLTHVERYPKAEHPIDVGFQSLTTADDNLVTVNATAIVVISDPLSLRQTVDYESWESWVAMMVRRSVTEVISGHNFSHTIEHGEEMVHSLCESTLEYAGVELVQVVLEDLTKTRPMRLFVNSPGSEL